MIKHIGVMLLATLFISSFFSLAGAQSDVEITIKGGLGCTITFNNHGNETVKGNFTYSAVAFLRNAGYKDIGNGTIKPHETFIYKKFVPYFSKVMVTAQAGDAFVEKVGISIFFITIFIPHNQNKHM